MPGNEKVRVLIVEDEVLMAEMVRMMLEARGYAVAGIARDGKEAVAMVESLTPDVVLLDLQLPIMNGFDAARAIQNVRPTPVVVLTAHDSPEFVDDATRAGVGAFLVKPPDVRELDRAITVARARFMDLMELRRLNERLEIEAAARAEREAECRSIIRTTADGFWVMDQEGRCLDVNQAFADMLGYSREEMFGMRIEDIEAPEGGGEPIRHVLEVVRLGYCRFETRHRRKDDDVLDVEVCANYLSDQRKIVVFSRDITERRRAEAKLRENEHRFRSFVENAGEIVYALTSDGVFTYVSPNWLDFMGEPAEKAMGRAFEAYVHPEDVPVCRGFLDKVLSTGERQVNAEYRVRRVDGSWRFHVSTGSPLRDESGRIAYVGIARDVTDQKLTEEALKESEERFRLTFDASPDAISINRLDNGIFQEINDGFTRSTGFTREEVIGKSAPEIHIWDNLADREELIRRLKEEGVCENFEALFRRKDGSPSNALMSARIIHIKNVPHIIAVTRDISERKRAEERLRFQARVLDQIQDLVTVTDLQGRITYANDAGCRIQGVPRDKIIGQHVSVYGDDPEVGATQEMIIQETLRNGEWRGEVVNLQSDGSPVLLDCRTHVVTDEAGVPFALCGISTDITERKRMETELSERERTFATLLANLPGFVYRCANDRDWAMKYISAGCLEITGYHPQEFLNGTVVFSEVIHPDFREHLWTQWQKVLEEKGLFQDEYIIVTKDGETRWVWERGQGVFSEAGQLLFLEGFITDITEKRRAEEERERLQLQLSQAQKMESVGRLAGGVAHDLNNLLAPIIGYAEMLLDDLGGEDKNRGFTQEILNAGLRARDLVQRLLAFSRKQTLEFKPVDLNRVVKGFEKLLRRTIREDITIHFQLAPSVPFIRGDVGRLEQVIMNLAVNAQDAMPDGGVLTVETVVCRSEEGRDESREKIEPGDYVGLNVVDTGSGMGADVMERLFEPFFTTKEVGKGTGLGLAICYGIVKQHGGYIRVQSKPGEGSTFRVCLPASRTNDEQPISHSSGSADAKGSETILLVEDNEQMRNLARAILDRQGYEVLTACNGMEALTIPDRHEGRIHLLLTDVVMPEMSGRDLSARILSRYPGIKVLYMSGYSENADGEGGMVDESVNFIQKPFSVRALAAKVREVLEAD